MFPLTHPQKRIIANQQIYRGSRFAHMYGKVRIETRSAAALSEAINAAISFFDCLRLRFVQTESLILQAIGPFRQEDIPQAPPGFDFFLGYIDLFDDRLYRFYITLDETGAPTGYFFIFHHAIVDAYTVPLIIKYIDDFFEGKAAAGVPFSVCDFSEAEENYLRSEDFPADKVFFDERLRRSLNFKYTPEFDLGSLRIEKTLTSELSGVLLFFCKTRKISVFKLIYSALFLLLYAENGMTTQTISTTHHGRDTDDLRQTGGMFASTIPVVQEIDPCLKLEDFLEDVSTNVSESLERFRFPVGTALSGLKPSSPFDLNITETMLTSIPFGDGDNVERYSPGEDVSYLNFKINPRHRPKGSDIEIAADYRTSRYTSGQAEGLLDRLIDISLSFIDSGDETILSLLSKPHHLQSPPGDVIVKIQNVIERNPDKTALVDGKTSLSYRQLGGMADAVAGALAGAGHIIGVVNERSLWYIAAVLGILKSGRAFTPLDLSMPAQRLNSIIKQTRMQTLLTFSENGCGLRGLKTIDIRELKPPVGALPVCVSRLAYILFTSGASGTPKGVMVGRPGLFSLLCALESRYETKESGNFSAYCDFNFDVSVAEILLPLFTASTLFIVSETQKRDLSQLDVFFRSNNIDHVFLPTKAGEAFIKNFPDCPVKNLTIVGEKMTYCRQAAYKVFNGYGPTEFTIFSHIEEIDSIACGNGRYSIGQPLDNVSDMIIPDGQSSEGELVLVGRQAAFGYLNDYKLTTERFFSILSSDGSVYQRAYRTSDRVEKADDGKLYFLQRIDRQIKLRGYRIEPGEIETAAIDSALIRDAACVYDGSELVLFVVPVSGYDKDRLLRFLSDRLPAYAMPQRIIETDDFPKNKAGKTDFQTLAKKSKSGADLSGGVREELALTEKELLGIFTGFAKQRHGAGAEAAIGAGDNIFVAGIDSLDILQIMLEIERKFGVSVRFSDFVMFPTIRELAGFVERPAGGENVIKLREGGGRPLVLVFDMSRDIIAYYPLLRVLEPGYPVYGIVSDFLPPDITLEDHAAFLAGELICKRQHDPEDLFDLAGYSSGGILALGIAKQLGEKAGSVFLIDTPNYKVYPKRLNYSFVLENLFSVIAAYGFKGFLSYVRKSFRGLARKRTITGEGKKLINMINGYEPQKPLFPVVLFATSEMVSRTDDCLGWKNLIPDDMIVYLEGRHISIMKEEAAGITGTIRLWRG